MPKRPKGLITQPPPDDRGDDLKRIRGHYPRGHKLTPDEERGLFLDLLFVIATPVYNALHYEGIRESEMIEDCAKQNRKAYVNVLRAMDTIIEECGWIEATYDDLGLNE